MTIYMLYLVVYGDMKVASIVEKKRRLTVDIHIEPSMLFVEATIDILCMVH